MVKHCSFIHSWLRIPVCTLNSFFNGLIFLSTTCSSTAWLILYHFLFSSILHTYCSLKSMLLGNKMASGHACTNSHFNIKTGVSGNVTVEKKSIMYTRLSTWEVFISFSCKAFNLISLCSLLKWLLLLSASVGRWFFNRTQLATYLWNCCEVN